MTNNNELEFIGEIVEVLPARRYKVQLVELDNIVVEWTLSWKMKMNKIKIMEGDYIKIELSQYEMSKGRIVYRYKNPQQAQEALDEKLEEATIEEDISQENE